MGVDQSGTYGTPRLDLGEALWEYMFSPDDFIGTRVYASLAVSKKEGKFPKILREGITRPGTKVKRAARSAYERGSFETEDGSYTCVERGQEQQLDLSEITFYADDFDVEEAAAKIAMQKVHLDQEIDIADTVFDGTTTFTVGNGRRTDVATAWSNKAAPIISDVQEAKEKVRGRTGEYANALVIGAGVIPFLVKNDEIKDALGTDKERSIDFILSRLAPVLGIDEIIVGKAVKNTAKKGKDFTGADVWDKIWAAVVKIVPRGAPITVPCVGRTPFWDADTPEGVIVEEYAEPQTRSKVIRARSFADELELDPDYEQLLDIAG